MTFDTVSLIVGLAAFALIGVIYIVSRILDIYTGSEFHDKLYGIYFVADQLFILPILIALGTAGVGIWGVMRIIASYS